MTAVASLHPEHSVVSELRHDLSPYIISGATRLPQAGRLGTHENAMAGR